jgi:hypothetical protein
VDLRERVALCKDFTPHERDLILTALGPEPALTASIMHSPSNYLGRIDAIWAALSLDDGGEGLCAAPVGTMTLPLIAADKRRLERVVGAGRRAADRSAPPR